MTVLVCRLCGKLDFSSKKRKTEDAEKEKIDKTSGGCYTTRK